MLHGIESVVVCIPRRFGQLVGVEFDLSVGNDHDEPEHEHVARLVIAGTDVAVFHGVQPRFLAYLAHDRFFGGFSLLYISREQQVVPVRMLPDEDLILRLVDGHHADRRLEGRKFEFPARIAVGNEPFVVAILERKFFSAILTEHNGLLLFRYF